MSTQRSGLRPSSDLELDLLIHELKGPIGVADAVVRSLLDRPERYGELNDRQQEVLRRALQGVERSRLLIRDLLEIGRTEAGRMSVTRFQLLATLQRLLFESLESTTPVRGWAQLDNEARSLALREAGIDLEVQGESVLEHDETKFMLLVGNLVRNALQFRRGRICVRTRLAEDTLHVEISDDGPGIPDEHRDAAFARYSRLQQAQGSERAGHGLGLAGSRYLAELLGGELELDERVGGALFGLDCPLRLPHRRHGVETRRRNLTDVHSELEGLRVLAVDDEPDVLATVEDVLVGVELDTAGDFDSALHKRRSNTSDLGYLPKEQLANLDTLIAEFLAEAKKGNSVWRLIFDKLDDYFERTFGADWVAEDPNYWRIYLH